MGQAIGPVNYRRIAAVANGQIPLSTRWANGPNPNRPEQFSRTQDTALLTCIYPSRLACRSTSYLIMLLACARGPARALGLAPFRARVRLALGGGSPSLRD